MDEGGLEIEYAKRIGEIAGRLVKLARDTAFLELLPGDLSALVFAEAEALRQIAEELAD